MTSLNAPPDPTISLDRNHLRSWTVQEYHRMSEVGILSADERTELIKGQIILMAA